MNGDLIYTKTIRFAYSDFDTYDHILPSSLQRFFQDIAGEQCDKLMLDISIYLSKMLFGLFQKCK